MNKSKILLTIATGIFIVSCGSDENITKTQALSEGEAVELIEASLAEGSGGLEETTYEYAKSYEEEISLNLQCNESINDTYNFQYDGSLILTNYDFNWQFLITCNAASIPQSATFTSEGNGTFNTQRIESDDSSTLTATITGLQPTAGEMIFNGTYARIGSQLLIANQVNKNISSNVNITISDLVVNKSDYEVSSGTGTFNLTGMRNDDSFSFDGTIVFNGNKTATIVVNGNEHTIELD